MINLSSLWLLACDNLNHFNQVFTIIWTYFLENLTNTKVIAIELFEFLDQINYCNRKIIYNWFKMITSFWSPQYHLYAWNEFMIFPFGVALVRRKTISMAHGAFLIFNCNILYLFVITSKLKNTYKLDSILIFYFVFLFHVLCQTWTKITIDILKIIMQPCILL